MNELERKALRQFRLPLQYDKGTQMVFDQRKQLVLDVRGLGYLQKLPEPEKVQDALGEMIVKAFNEKYYL